MSNPAEFWASVFHILPYAVVVFGVCITIILIFHKPRTPKP